ncbi:ABC transporter ATP-binding protein [Enterobacteriaceae bacterium H11S18]|uniref:ABC transporter ATP-binding protein n=1 Tax=Dryocola clanedunensis TaxID=2925396 RepID=UPI0022F0E571|nr:ABC transporter ATP-binding protein [Dryocola clanedunensis]MCT4706550.1 ABC transporter ATP-binding protein [Dryocola clanedunensis]MCT4713364.1 ABC transporter ATP-binding protein [Dryocola clanedunensis]
MKPELAEDVILSVRNLQTRFTSKRQSVTPVDGVTFDLKRGQTLAVVGESGSGKSVTSLSIMGLLGKNGHISGGEILYRTSRNDIQRIDQFTPSQYQKIRGKEIAMIFQEPMTSLNPLFTVGEQIMEMILLHEPMSKAQARLKAIEMLEKVEIPEPATRVDDYPHSMSGGMRQRVMIALALSCNPALLIADEPTTALDVTIQAQILDLLKRLQSEMGMSIIFITHNLGVVAEIAQDVVVMYAGRVVEHAPVATLFAHPSHPYTKGLLACTPNNHTSTETERGQLYAIPGSVPALSALPAGCAFSPRCSFVNNQCLTTRPELRAIGNNTWSRCIWSERL